MDLLNNLGISYIGDYILQGSSIDRLKKSSQLGINYTEFVIRNDGKDMDFNNLSDIYKGNVIFHLPSINNNQSNLKIVKELLLVLLKNNIKLVTIDASSLLFETFEWSTEEEQQNYLKNTARGLATLVSCGVNLAIENPNIYEENMLFGKNVKNLSDILVYTRNILVEEFEYSKEKADISVGVSLNINNMINCNESSKIDEWFKIFYNDIKCIKVNNMENNIILFNEVLDEIINNKIDVPFVLETDVEIEEVSNEYKKFEYLVKNKIEGKPLNLNNYQNLVRDKDNEYNYNISSSQSGFTNLVVIMIILVTIVIAALMVIVELKP